MHRKIPVLALIGLLLAGPASAGIFNFVTSIDDAQELSCGLSSDARGSGTATLNDASGAFSWIFTFGRNSPSFTDALLQRGAESGAHIHGPASIGVGGAGIQVVLASGSPKTGSTTLNSTQMADLIAGLYYVNIHSTGCPGGEIRGQLVSAPAGSTLPGAMPFALVGLLALALATGLALRAERSRT